MCVCVCVCIQSDIVINTITHTVLCQNMRYFILHCKCKKLSIFRSISQSR